MRRRSTAPMSTVLPCAPPIPRAPSDGAPKRLYAQCRSDRLRHRARARSRARHRDRDRNRRRHAARRRCRGDDRAHRTDRGRRSAGDRTAPRRRAAGNSSPMPAPTSRAAKPCCARARASARARSACSRPAALPRSTWCGRPRVAVLSTGDELVEPGRPLRPGGVYDSNGAIIAAAIAEAGGEPVPFGAFPDDEAGARTRHAQRARTCDMVVLSGGTSKGAGDLSHRIVSRLGAPGILVHGVALKPGKPLCLAVIGDKPLDRAAGLSDLGDFHLSRLRGAGDPRPRRAAAGSGANGDGARAGADRIRAWPRGIRAGLARRRRRRPDRVPDRQRLGRGDGFFPGRRIFGDRCARLGARCRHRGRGHADRRRRARAGSRHHGQPRCRARCRGRRARRARLSRAHHRRRQPRRRHRGRAAANAMSRRSISSIRRPASTTSICSRPGLALRARLAADAGLCLSPGRRALRRQERRCRAARQRSPIPPC